MPWFDKKILQYNPICFPGIICGALVKFFLDFLFFINIKSRFIKFSNTFYLKIAKRRSE